MSHIHRLECLDLAGHPPQFSSASRLTAGASGFLLLIQCGERPELYREPCHFERVGTLPRGQTVHRRRCGGYVRNPEFFPGGGAGTWASISDARNLSKLAEPARACWSGSDNPSSRSQFRRALKSVQ
jgi:hypothetical protein